jgi:hypothetical protein
MVYKLCRFRPPPTHDPLNLYIARCDLYVCRSHPLLDEQHRTLHECHLDPHPLPGLEFRV